jgi:uncharacterized protein
MPYYITDESPDCPAWAVVKADGELVACHSTKESATEQMVAVSLEEGLEPGGTYTKQNRSSSINSEERAAAGTIKVGDYATFTDRNQNKYGEVQEIIAQGSIMVPGSAIQVNGTAMDPAVLIQVYEQTIDGWIETSEFIAKHMSAIQWTQPLMAVVDEPQMRSSSCEDCDGNCDVCKTEERSQRRITGRMKLENLLRAKGKGVSKVETRVNAADFEIREEADGMRFSGYAAVFNSPSEPLPFTETIKRGAFHKTLRSKNDVKFLWNHDSGEILGSVRGKTLTLTEDERGLKVEGILPNTSRGRDVAELLKRGDVDSMSFGFSVPAGGDEWSADGATRTLNSVRLHEVSLVAFPAYTGTAGLQSVRGLEGIAKRMEVDADQLADAWIKVEEGQSLTEDEGRLLKQVVDSLIPQDEVLEATESESDLAMLELKKKKLSLMTGK